MTPPMMLDDGFSSLDLPLRVMESFEGNIPSVGYQYHSLPSDMRLRRQTIIAPKLALSPLQRD